MLIITPPAPASSDLMKETPEERNAEAWRMLTDAMGDAKHPEVRIQGLAALGPGGVLGPGGALGANAMPMLEYTMALYDAGFLWLNVGTTSLKTPIAGRIMM